MSTSDILESKRWNRVFLCYIHINTFVGDFWTLSGSTATGTTLVIQLFLLFILGSLRNWKEKQQDFQSLFFPSSLDYHNPDDWKPSQTYFILGKNKTETPKYWTTPFNLWIQVFQSHRCYCLNKSVCKISSLLLILWSTLCKLEMFRNHRIRSLTTWQTT